ncbi:MAG: ATP-binding protein [Syntrophobacteraceae bacterium]
MRDLTIRDKAAVIGFLLFALTVLNYSAHAWIGHPQFDRFDVVFQKLYFLPVILGSFWFALKGGLIVSSIAAASLVPYLILHWEGLSALDLNRLLLIAAYFLMAAVLGKAVLMQRREHQRAREAETLAAIGKSMSAMAHEMRTPIIAIGGFARMVRKNIADGSPDAEKLDIVMTEALRLENLLRGVLDFARPLVVQRESTKVDKMIHECLAITGHVAEQHGIVLEVRMQADLPPVSLDEMRMKQVLINLITNAIQASPQGEKVTVGCSLLGRSLVMEIIDCGCGIPERKREEVFSPFFSTKKEGVGLGLPIVKKIVEAHEGDLRIEDNPSGGVIFRIEIPDCMERSIVQNAEPPPVSKPEACTPNT